MPSQTVEFRYLRVITNHLSGDSCTVGVTHWDGETLRYAFSLANLPNENAMRDVRAAVEFAERHVRSLAASPQEAATLTQLVPGSFGKGDSTVWGELRRGITGSPAAHFSELVSKLRLLAPPKKPKALSRAISDALASLADDFKEYPDRVQSSVPLHDHYGYTSPVSWRNGAWNHTIPLVLEVSSKAELQTHVRDVISRVITSIPKTATPVVVAVLPHESSPLYADARRDAEYVQHEASQHEARRPTRLARVGTNLDLSTVRDMIRADIENHRDALD